MSITHLTPKQIQNFLDEHQHQFDFPYWPYGDEPNTVIKDWDAANFRFCIFSVADYIQFTANQTVPLLYEMANEAGEDILGARAYFPATRKELDLLKRYGIPIFGVEHKQPLGHFDMFGVSSSYSGFYLNMVQGMKMSGLPRKWEDRVERAEEYPLVMMGGMGSYVPTPYDPVVDLVFIGEAEDEPGNPGFMAMLRDLKEYKQSGYFARGQSQLWEEMLHEMCRKYTFLYRPAFYTPRYHPVTWHEKVWDRKYDDLPRFVRKRFAVNLDETFFLKRKPLPWVDTGMGYGELEISRGCQASCLFCAEGYRYRPYRERSVDYLVPAFKELVKWQGALHAFPAAFEFSGYTKKKELVRRLLEEVSDEVDTQSQRVDNFARDPSFGITLAALGDMGNLTIAIEGNSQRMRDVISKGCTEKEILEVFDIAFRSGYKRVKAFVISDLPGETPEDTMEIVELARKIMTLRDSYGKGTTVLFSWTPLFTEGWTPFQYAPASVLSRNDALAVAVREISGMGASCSLGQKTKNMNYTWSQLFAMADRRLAECLLETAEESDASFFAHIGASLEEPLRKAMTKRGLTEEFYFREKPDDTVFPWDFVICGVGKAALKKYWQKAKDYLTQTDFLPGGHLIAKCDMDCIVCGACEGDLPEILQTDRANDARVNIAKVKVLDQKTLAQRVLFKVEKSPKKRFVGNDHWKIAIRRAAFLADLPITKRHILFPTDTAKIKPWSAGADYVEIGWMKRIWNKKTADGLMQQLNEFLTDYAFKDWKEVPLGLQDRKSLSGTSLWSLEVDRQDVKRILEKWEAESYFPVTVREDVYGQGLVRVEYNAHDFVNDLWFIQDGATLRLKMILSGKISPYDMHQALFGSRTTEAYRYPATKLEGFVEQDTDSESLLAAACDACGDALPVTLMGKTYRPYGTSLCPRHGDDQKGILVDRDLTGVLIHAS